jgi:hypothetical protein
MVSDYVFFIYDPSGNPVASVYTPWNGGISFPVNIPDGKGIWHIFINRTTSKPAPVLMRHPSGTSVVSNPFPFVTLNSRESLLGIAFIGEEILSPCPTDDEVTITTEIEYPPTSGTWKDIANFPCVPQNEQVRFTANVNPRGATIQKYKWNFKDPNALTLPTSPNSNNPERLTAATTDTQTHFYTQPQPNQQAYAPTVQVFLQPPCDPIVGSTSVRVCSGCPKIDNGSLKASFGTPPQQLDSSDPNSCVPVNTQINFEVVVSNPDNENLTLDWDYGDGSSETPPQITGNPATAKVQHTYTQWRLQPYTVRVTLRVPQHCSSSYASLDVRVCSPPTTCPQITDVIPTLRGAPEDCADGAGRVATFDFQATVANQASVVGDYEWDFGDPNSGAQNTAKTSTPNASHSYGTPSPPSYTVKVKVNGPSGCAPSDRSTTVNVPGCPIVPPNDDGDTNWGCGILRILLALLFAGLILTVVGGACLNWAWGVAVGFFIAAVIALILWIIFCQPSFCEVLLLLWQTWFAATMVLLWISGCFLPPNPCPIVAFAWIVAVIITVGFFVWWVLRCKPSFCNVLSKLLSAVVDTGALIGMFYLGMKYLGFIIPMCNTLLHAVPAGLAIAVLVISLILGFRCRGFTGP